MDKYVWRGFGKIKCSFCGIAGHNIRSCTAIPIAAESTTMSNYVVNQAKEEMAKRQEIAKRRSKKRAKPKCGFCRDSKHNRVNCTKMKEMEALLYKANANWRRFFLDRVNALGVAPGALVETYGVPVNIIGQTSWLGRDLASKHLGIVKSFDLEGLTFFCNFGGSYEYRSGAGLDAKLTTSRGYVDISIGYYLGQDVFHKNAFFQHYNRIKVISPAKISDMDDWIDERDIPTFKWLLKTHTLEQLQDYKLIDHMKHWANE
jgi:hypothetical protein